MGGSRWEERRRWRVGGGVCAVWSEGDGGGGGGVGRGKGEGGEGEKE